MGISIPDAIKIAANNLTLKSPSSSLGSVPQVAADGIRGLREGSRVLRPEVHKPSQHDPNLARFSTDQSLLKSPKGSPPVTRSNPPPVVRQGIIRDEDEFDDPHDVTIEDVSDCSDDCEIFDLDDPIARRTFLNPDSAAGNLKPFQSPGS